MIPANASAFAVYSGKISSPDKQKRKRRKNKKNGDTSQTKLEKIDKLLKKKEKKIKALNTDDLTANNLESVNLKKSKLKKVEKILDNVSKNSDTLKKKKKKKKSSKNDDSSLCVSEKSGSISPRMNITSGMDDSDPRVKEPTHNNIASQSTDKKVKKKVKISSNLPVIKSDIFRSKIVVSTPRVFLKRKNGSCLSDFNSPKSSILSCVDSYVAEKMKSKNIDSREGASTSKKSSVVQTLAAEAKMKAEKQGSKEAFGEPTLQSILEPFNLKSFLRDYWEKKPLHVPGKKDKFSSFLSTELIDSILRENVVLFGKHVDVTTYMDGVRETHNPEGRAHAHIVWDFYSNGCSVRFLNPQYFLNGIHLLNSHLQEMFGCFVGSNVYLTPPNSQGFAPHFDDIEAIILQVEGSKYWKIYAPLDNDGVLPRYSSRNFSPEEIGEPLMEVKLSAGDVLYFPRGYIHQGRTEGEHSLHITLSTYQRTSWADLLEKLLPATLKKACLEDVEFRRGLPLGYLESAGLAHPSSPQLRKTVLTQLKTLLSRLSQHLELDSAIDQMGLKFIQEALPPVLTPREAACSVVGGGMRMERNGALSHHIFIPPETRVRWIRKHCYRLVEVEVMEDDGSLEKQTRIYYSLDNSREYRSVEPQYLIIPPELLAGVLHLTAAYPEYTAVSELPLDQEEDKITLVGDLWDRGLLVTDRPLEAEEPTEDNPPAPLPTESAETTLNPEENEVYEDLVEAVQPQSSHHDDTEMTDASELEGNEPDESVNSSLPQATNGHKISDESSLDTGSDSDTIELE